MNDYSYEEILKWRGIALIYYATTKGTHKHCDQTIERIVLEDNMAREHLELITELVARGKL